MDNIKDKYDFIGEFHQGVAIVVKDDKYGAILVGGHEIIPTTYDYISTFKDGYAQAIRNGKCITINLSGKESVNSGNRIIEIFDNYDEVRGFYNGVACVRKQDRWGVIDDKGKEIVPPQFVYISDFIFNLASYKSENNTWGFISPEGHVSKNIYADMEIDVDGTLITTRHIRFFIDAFNTKDVDLKKVRLNRNGSVLIQSDDGLITLPPYIYFAQSISEGIICAQNSSGLWGAITCSGEQIVPFEYVTIQDFKEGRSFSMDRNGKLHLLSSDGKINKILESYTGATSFVHGYANIYQKHQCGLIDKSGKVVLMPNYTDIRYSGTPNSYILIEDGKEGLFNVVTGTEITPQYNRIVSIEDDYILVEIPVLGTIKIEDSGKSFVLHNDQVKYLPEWCIGGIDYDNDICYAISEEGKWGIVDQDGNTICKPVFDKIIKREGNLIYTESNKNGDSWKDEIYGVFDIETKVVIPAEYAEYPQKKDNYYLVCKYNKKIGAIDLNGNVVVNPEYSDVKWLDGYYQIFNEGKVGLVGSDGTIILLPQYCKIEVIKYGLFKVYTNRNSNTWQICNDKGLNHKKYDGIGPINEDGNFPVTYNGRSGLVNTFGQFVISDENNNYILVPEKFEWAENFNNGVTKVWEHDHDGLHFYYVDKKFNQVLLVENKVVYVKTEIDRIVYENSERCQAFIFKLDRKFGLLSKEGELLVKPKFYNLGYCSVNLYFADIKEDYFYIGKYGIIDEKENIILPFEYSNLKEECEFIISMKTLTDRGYEWVNNYGLINSKKETIFEPIFQKIIGFKKGFFVLEDNKWYIVDKIELTKKETDYSSIEQLSNNYFRFSKLDNNSYFGVLDSFGEECLSPIYSSIENVNSYNVAIIDLNGKKGLTDEKYCILVEPQYDYMSEFKDGKATVEKQISQVKNETIRGEIDIKGNFVEISELTEYDISKGKTKQIKTLSNGYIVLRKDDPNPLFQYCAVVDKDNNTILPYKYYHIDELENGMYKVSSGSQYSRYFGLLDKDFIEIVEPTFAFLEPIESGFVVSTSVGYMGKNVGFMNSVGKITIPLEYSSIRVAWGDKVWIYANNNNSIGLATIDGDILIKPCFGQVEPLENGYAKVNVGHANWGIVDISGKLVVPTKYDFITINEDGTFSVFNGIRYGRLNKDGKLIIKDTDGNYILSDFRFDWQYDFDSNGFSCISCYKEQNEHIIEEHGKINSQGQFVVSSKAEDLELFHIIPDGFDWAYYCSEETFIGVKNDKKGVFNYDGTEIISAEYNDIQPVNDIYIVRKDCKAGVLADTGEVILPIVFNFIEIIEDPYSGKRYYKCNNSGNSSLYSLDGTEIISAEYNDIQPVNDIYIVRKDCKAGVLADTGEVILPLVFNFIEIIEDPYSGRRYYKCNNSGNYGLYNLDGSELIPTNYSQIAFLAYNLLLIQGTDSKFMIFNSKGTCINSECFDAVFDFGKPLKKREFSFENPKEIEDPLYAIVQKNGLYGAINSLGVTEIYPKYKELYCVNRKVFYGDCRYIDSHGRKVAFLGDEIVSIDYNYDSAVLLENGLILVQQNRLYGCINKKGDVVIPIQYRSLSYSDKLFAASIYDEDIKKLKYGVLNILNKEVVPLNDGYADIKIENGLILCRIGGYWGAFTLYGKVICEPKYSHIKPLTEYIIKVGIDYSIGWNSSSETYWGLINVDGEELLTIDRYNAKYTICDRLFNGFIAYYVDGNRIGYLDVTGREVLKPIYVSVGEFVDGYAIVAKTKSYTDYDGNYRKKNIYGVVDNSFKEIIPCVFNKVEYESKTGLFKTDLGYKTTDGRFIVEIGNERLFVNAKYKNCEEFHKGCAIAIKIENDEVLYGLINTKSEDILPPIFQWLKLSDNGLYKFKMNEMYGFVDSNGNITIPNRYHRIGKFEDNLAVVTIKKEAKDYGKYSCLYGFIDNCGKEILPPVYEYMGKKSEGKVVLMKNNIWGIFDIKTKGTRMALHANYIGICKEGLCRFNVGGTFDKSNSKMTGGTWGYINTKGQIIISPIYEKVLGFSDGIAAVKQNGKWGFIDINGVIVVPCKYDEIGHSFYNGQGSMIKDDTVFVFDKSGILVDSYEKEKPDDYYSGGYDDEPSIYDNPYYNDNLDMDQQSIEFWNNL